MRIDFRLVAAIALTISLAACDKKGDQASTPTQTTEAVSAPAGTDWTETVTVTPAGGYLLGNPNAPVKLLEYA